jgi:ankyrin repeat protein
MYYSQYLKEKRDIIAIAGISEEIEYMLARGQLDLPVTLCYAASKGDDFLMHQLLKRGVHPNESDNYWHTALVILIFTISITVFFAGYQLQNLRC